MAARGEITYVQVTTRTGTIVQYAFIWYLGNVTPQSSIPTLRHNPPTAPLTPSPLAHRATPPTHPHSTKSLRCSPSSLSVVCWVSSHRLTPEESEEMKEDCFLPSPLLPPPLSQPQSCRMFAMRVRLSHPHPPPLSSQRQRTAEMLSSHSCG